MTKDDLSTYFNLIYNEELDEAMKYRMGKAPKKIYKYIGLDSGNCKLHNNLCLNSGEINQSKISCVLEDKLWLSSFDSLNDPFEFKAMYLDKKKIDEFGWSIESLEESLKIIRNTYLIGSFTVSEYKNMPMWAHYANNHKGFCIEYLVEKPQHLYPVNYEEKRFPVAKIIVNAIALMSRMPDEKLKKELDLYITIINHFGMIKHLSWEYEKEQRIYFPNLDDVEIGKIVPISDIGLKLNGIYLDQLIMVK